MSNEILILIPARGGSKGIPNKNIRLLKGKPLIAYTIEAAREIVSADCICVSTDSEEIKSVAESFGIAVPFLRPEALASDTATTESVIEHVLESYKNRRVSFKTVIVLQPTSPLRNGNHIKEAYQVFQQKQCDMVVSVKETKANPYYLLFEEDHNGFLEKSKSSNATRRQDVPTVYELNGAIYIFDGQKFLENGLKGLTRRVKYIMDDFSSVDIDTEIDWLLCESILTKYN